MQIPQVKKRLIVTLFNLYSFLCLEDVGEDQQKIGYKDGDAYKCIIFSVGTCSPRERG